MPSIDTCSRPGTVSLAALVILALVPTPAWSFHTETHCQEKDRCSTDAQCSDRDPCTLDSCVPAVDTGRGEGCCSHDAITPCLDTFLCLDVEASEPVGPARARHVRITDPLEDLRFGVGDLREVCAPADRDGAGVHDPGTRLDRYQIVPVGARATPLAANGVKAETSLGAVLVDIVGSDRLFVPAANDRAAPNIPNRDSRDHFKCYDVKPSSNMAKPPESLQLTLANQLIEAPKAFVVIRPSRLCTAADLNGEGYGNACGALLCYAVEAASKKPRFSRMKGLSIHDRFGSHHVDALREGEVCLPAVVNDRTCLPRGFACETNFDCKTGYCVDGVCCGTACDAACYACIGSLTGEPHGTCAPIAAGGASDTAPVSLCGGSTGCTSGPCACDGLGHCTAGH